jgi:hypothetical protein
MNKTVVVAGVLCGALVALVVALLLFYHPGEPPATNVVADQQLARVQATVNLLQQVCLVNLTAQDKATVEAALNDAAKQLGASATAEKSSSIVRGVVDKLSSGDLLKDREEVRDCMDKRFDQILATLRPPAPAAASGLSQGFPDPMATRIKVQFKPSGGAASHIDSKEIMVAMTGDHRVVERTWLSRQPAGYYTLNTGYPAPDETWRGVISAVTTDETELASHFAKICFGRPPAFEPQQEPYVLFSCEEGKVCRLDDFSPKWVTTCDPDQKMSVSLSGPLGISAFAAERRAGWSIPSLRTWKRQAEAMQGVGFTEFTLSTDAFSGRGVYAVAVKLSVDGTPVLEDGVPADLRPEPYAGKGAFTYGFGLRSLDLQGIHGGCDRIEVEFKPLGTNAPLTVARNYAALLPMAAANVAAIAGKGEVNWQGVYHTPKDAFENEVFVASITFALKSNGDYDSGSQQAALQKITALKAAFDKLGLTYQGRPLAGVIRPPLTNPAYGLAVGWYEMPDKFRFTFGFEQASKLRAAVAPGLAGRDGFATPLIYAAAGNQERASKIPRADACPAVG